MHEGPNHEEDTHSYYSREITGMGFPGFSTRDLFGQMILCCGGCFVHHTMFTNIPGLYTQDANSIPRSAVTPKMSPGMFSPSGCFTRLCFPYPSFTERTPQRPGLAHLSLPPYTLP